MTATNLQPNALPGFLDLESGNSCCCIFSLTVNVIVDKCRPFGIQTGVGVPLGSSARFSQDANAVEVRPRIDSMGEDKEEDQNKVVCPIVLLLF